MIIATVQGLIVLLVARLLGFEPLGGLAGLLLAALFLALLAISAVGLGLITASVSKDTGRSGRAFGDIHRAHDDVWRAAGRLQRNDPQHCPLHAQLLRFRFTLRHLPHGAPL